MASVALRLAVWLVVLAAAVVLAFWKPLALIAVGVALALVLLASKLLGDLLWNEGVRPMVAESEQPTKNETPNE